MRRLPPVVFCLVATALSVLSARPADGQTKGDPAPPPGAEAYEREVRAARSYLEGWFGSPMQMPPIEIAAAGGASGSDLPGHYQDGIIRLRPETIQAQSELRRVLRHELTHAVIDEKTRGNCPHWLQEGIAQFLDGTDVVATEAWLRRGPPLIPLYRIEGPFRERDAESRELAYRESASAVSFLVSRIGRPGLLFLISRLGEGRPFERALLESGLSYAELQQAWQASLQRGDRPRQRR